MTETERKTNDFTQGAVPAVVTRMALPLIAAQLVNVLYNVVDRVYIGHIPVEGSAALTGVGVALPVITALSALRASSAREERPCAPLPGAVRTWRGPPGLWATP